MDTLKETLILTGLGKRTREAHPSLIGVVWKYVNDLGSIRTLDIVLTRSEDMCYPSMSLASRLTDEGNNSVSFTKMHLVCNRCDT